MTLKLHETVCKSSQIWLIYIPARFRVASNTDIRHSGMTQLSDVIKNYTRFVIFEKNAVHVLLHWASFPALPYIYFDLTIVNLVALQVHRVYISTYSRVLGFG